MTTCLGWRNQDELENSLADVLNKVIKDIPIKEDEAILHHSEGVDLVLSNIDLETIELGLVNIMSREFILKSYLNQIKDKYDYVIIDCRPSLSMITLNALASSDSVIIPVQAHYLSAKGMTESIKTEGFMHPLIVRQRSDGNYEIISGHRRKKASELAQIKELPCIIRNLTDDEAIIQMVDSNMQREKILPSEKAFAYKMKLEAQKHQGKRTDLTSSQLATKLNEERTAKKIGNEFGESKDTVYRYIRLTELIPELLILVDDERISFSPAVELSYLKDDEQYIILNIYEYDEATPTLS